MKKPYFVSLILNDNSEIIPLQTTTQNYCELVSMHGLFIHLHKKGKTIKDVIFNIGIFEMEYLMEYLSASNEKFLKEFLQDKSEEVGVIIRNDKGEVRIK